MKQHGHTHGGKPTREWLAWFRLRKRCGVVGSRAKLETKQRGVPKYVERGMAEEWKHDFPAFYNYIVETIGLHPGEGWSIDRIDNDRGYFPGNIRWMLLSEQRVQGGNAPHRPPTHTDQSREGMREGGRKVGMMRGASGKRGTDGKFIRES